MPITKSAKKALRGSARKRVFNLKRKAAIKNTAKEVKKVVVEKNAANAKGALAQAYKAIDKAVKTGVKN